MYALDYRILSSDTDAFRRLRLSRLFTLLQEASIAHTTALGMGREKTLDRGLLWIVTLQQADVTRLPVYDEQIRLLSWPGETMHLFFPRWYRLEDAAGQTLVEAGALWALMDCRSRRLVFPEEHGVAISGERTGREPPFPAAPRAAQGTVCETFTVPYSCVDFNGHVNNARYFDLAEDRMPAALRERSVRRIRAEYAREIRADTAVALRAETQEDCFLLSGEAAGGQRLFRLSLEYAAAK